MGVAEKNCGGYASTFLDDPHPASLDLAALGLGRATLPFQGRVGACGLSYGFPLPHQGGTSRIALRRESRFASDESDTAAVIDGRGQSGNGMTGASSGCAAMSPKQAATGANERR